MDKRDLVIVLIVFAFVAYMAEATGYFSLKEQAIVFNYYAIDGDTLALGNGERVRLVGIDSPERGQRLYLEARDFLKERLDGSRIRLDAVEPNLDRYGRLLRYVYVGDSLVNLDIVRSGFAKVFLGEESREFEGELLEAEAYARENKLGVWQYDPSVFCISLFWLNHNAEGDDRENLNGEYVIFKNNCDEGINLKGWKVADKEGNEYVFYDFDLESGRTINLHTGSGEDNELYMFWGKRSPVWGNEGDTLHFWNNKGELILNYTYPDS